MKLRSLLITLSLFILVTFSFAFLDKKSVLDSCKTSYDKKNNEKQSEFLPENSVFNPLNRLLAAI